MSSRCTPPFITMVIDSDLSKSKIKKCILSRAFNGIRRCLIICSKLNMMIMFCDQVRDRFSKINKLMYGPSFKTIRMCARKCVRCEFRETFKYSKDLQLSHKLCKELVVHFLQCSNLVFQ